jgi:hypothetical protein
VFCGGVPVTGPTADEVEFPEPAVFAAVTRTLIFEPTSAPTSVYVAVVDVP